MKGPFRLDRAALIGRSWDVLVVGAGPAGAFAAREAARRGATTLLVDKAPFPRYKICGCCLSGRVLQTLRAAGLGELTAACGAVPLTSFHLAAKGRYAHLALPEGAALSRSRFDSALVQAAEDSGVLFAGGCSAQLGTPTPADWEVSLKQGHVEVVVRARIVLAADGLGGRFLKGRSSFASAARPGSRIGAGAVLEKESGRYEPGVIYMAWGRGGYVGLVLLEDGRLNLAAAFDPPFVKDKGGLSAAASETLSEAGLPLPRGLAASRLRGTLPLTRQTAALSGHRLLVLGDAAGYVEPFTGEGIGWALESARAAASLACTSLEDFTADTEARWSAQYTKTIGGRQGLCKAIAWALRRPALAGPSLAALKLLPFLVSPMVRRLNVSPVLEGPVS